ncbi:acyl-CoA dehydrogenase [bacterium]|nr:acyl-CoA dehydrogenase [bacterium]
MDSLNELCGQLRDQAATLGSVDAWPGEQLGAMGGAGVLGWLIPQEFGGSDISAAELVSGYEQLAAACLTSTFVLTQRNAAIQRIVKSGNEELKKELLPELVDHSQFVTVGISHLTTSRQHWKQPTVAVEMLDGGFLLNGEIPWVTGGDRADVIVTGGTLANGRQVLLAVEKCCEGLEMREPVSMLALNASRTGSIGLNHVFVPWTHLLHGPAENVMQQGGGGAGTLTTSALAIGHAANAVSLLRAETERRPELNEILEPLASDVAEVSTHLHEAVTSDENPLPGHLTAESLRHRSNSLALRASQAALAASKGAGFVTGHPAGRLVAEAMFFLVWSCPQPVVMANLREFASVCSTGEESWDPGC